jgi:nicotinate dehydrogenase subunit B
LDESQLIFVRHDTNITPNTGGTFGSSSISSAGPRVRSAAATARQTLLSMAATQLGVPVANLSVAKGTVSGGGRPSYGQLISDRLFSVVVAGEYHPRPSAVEAVAHSIVSISTTTPRVDIPDKATGTYAYVITFVFRGWCMLASSAHGAPARTRWRTRSR